MLSSHGRESMPSSAPEVNTAGGLLTIGELARRAGVTAPALRYYEELGLLPAPAGNALISPMQGTIIKIVVADGEQVQAGDVVVVLEAMKMEQPLNAHKDGTVAGLTAAIGETVTSGAAICQID